MKLRKTGILALTLMLLLPGSGAMASMSQSFNQASSFDINSTSNMPLLELQQVYYILQENHLDKPSEKKLVQGALQGVQQYIKAEKHAEVVVDEKDDTITEMVDRITQWQAQQKLDWYTVSYYGIEGMLAQVNDPYTTLFTETELDQFQNSVNNNFVGFGIIFRETDNGFIVRSVVENSPAAKAGIHSGDKLEALNGSKITVKGIGELNRILQGEEGTSATLTFSKSGTVKMKDYTIKRSPLVIPEATSKLFGSKSTTIGYVKLDTFGSDAGDQFKEQLDQIENQKKLTGLIIDLRDNSGGYLNAAKDIASLFMENGLLMYTTNRNDVEVENWVRNGRPAPYPVTVLVNGQTASASEMLAGALQDHKIAKLIGTKTFGKGIAQTVLPLVDGDALKVTLQEYKTPAHRKVNKVGLEPDIVIEDDISQVVGALYELGEKRIEVRQKSGFEVVVNGVSFYSTSPLLKKVGNSLNIRSTFMQSMLREKTAVSSEYRPIVSVTNPTVTFTWKKENDEYIFISEQK
ncbi:S41 family peptidase [Brevibacillus laterosporus]|uniref:S41 family peptidase n=1 Tax=Brevibacillus laterosporus TaxID=1465 RepID=UPI000EB339DF|nr:S41 family peptidase [Brevibacillus laterosporus]AYK07300.1 S41 family peptidase [Brevibacillus laterosporus]